MKRAIEMQDRPSVCDKAGRKHGDTGVTSCTHRTHERVGRGEVALTIARGRVNGDS